MVAPIEIALIGGSGLYNMPDLSQVEEVAIRTPFGPTSDVFIKGMIAGQPVVFIPRHARGHRLTPSEVPYAANIYALKQLGVKYILAVSACGSLREDYQPGRLCLPDQVVDRTFGRRASFFGEGLVAHVSMAEAFCPELRHLVAESATSQGIEIYQGGTFVTVEGPRFSTRAESESYRQLGYSLVGMTTATEAFLALEAEIAYAVIAHITDYDVWRVGEEVSAAAVMERVKDNLDHIQKTLVAVIPQIAAIDHPLMAHESLKYAITTPREHVPPKTLEKLRPIVGKYFSDEV